jgi:nucleotide-binding universal stress UspA family protein
LEPAIGSALLTWIKGFLGGVTREVLSEATIPVLMSH